MQDRAIRMMQIHTELLGMLFCGQRTVFLGSLPASMSMNAVSLLRVWDYEGLLTQQVPMFCLTPQKIIQCCTKTHSRQ